MTVPVGATVERGRQDGSRLRSPARMATPAFNEVVQVGLVVRDLEAAVRTYADEYGIGPWEIFDITPGIAEDMAIRGEPREYAMRIALTMVGNVQLELIQPLDDKTPHAEFLATHGEGIHHLAVGVEDYAEALERFRELGHGVVLSGRYKGATYAYLDTQAKLHFVAEIFDLSGIGDRKPDAVYPPAWPST